MASDNDMRLSSERIAALKLLLKEHYDLDLDNEQAQAAGRAILKFVSLKVRKQINEDDYGNEEVRLKKVR